MHKGPQHSPYRAYAAYTLVALVMIALAAAAIVAVGRVQTRTRDLQSEAERELALSARLQIAWERKIAAERGYLISGADELAASADSARADFLATAHAIVAEGFDGELVKSALAAEAKHEQASRRAFERRRTEPLAAVERDFADVLTPLRADADAEIHAVMARSHERLEQLRYEAHDLLERTGEAVAAIALLAVLLTLAIGLAEVRLTRQSRRALAQWGTFLSVASHDVRTPLMALRLRGELLERLLDREGVESVEIRKTVAAMLRQTDAMSSLVEGILDVARLRLGGLSIRPRRVDLGHLVDDVAERLRFEFDRRGVELTVSADKGIVGEWDPERIDQVVTNLLRNALEHGGGAPVEIRASADGGIARLVVHDEGPGLPTGQEIFGDVARPKRTAKGHGLGLWITKMIVDAHGANIRCESAPGRGTTFSVDLPKAHAT